MMGAQQASGKQPSPLIPNATTAQPIIGENGRIVAVSKAGPPQPATDGDGNPVAVTESANAGPPKLPGVAPGQNTLTEEQMIQLENQSLFGSDPTSSTNPSNQDIATDGG